MAGHQWRRRDAVKVRFQVLLPLAQWVSSGMPFGITLRYLNLDRICA